MAQQTLNNGETGQLIRGKINDNFTDLYSNSLLKSTGGMYPGVNTFQAPAIVPGSGVGVISEASMEFVNIGNPLNGTENRHRTPGGVFRMHGSILIGRNVAWDQANSRFYQPYNTTSDWGTSVVECGGEGVLLAACGPVAGTGSQYINTPREIFKVSAQGLFGVDASYPGSRYFAQLKAPLLMKYSSAAYGVGNVWNPTDGDDPMIWLLGDEAKSPSSATLLQEYQRLESNYNGVTGAMLYFRKSRGTRNAKTTSSSGDTAGGIRYSFYDGTNYQNTVQLRAQIEAGATAGVAPSSFIISTSETDTAGLTDRFTVKSNGVINMSSLPTSSAGLSAGDIWNDSGTLKVA